VAPLTMILPHLCEWKKIQLIIIFDLPNGGCYLVSLLAIHHNHCVISEICWFFYNLNKNLRVKIKNIYFNLCKHYEKSLFFLLGILVKKFASYGFFAPMFNLTKVPFWTNQFGLNHFD